MLEIVKTADGSNTIFNPLVGENYHSVHGALQESRHVFINAGLLYFLERRENSQSSAAQPGAVPNSVSILEVGFGTGLNFLLTADVCSEKLVALDYTGIEAYPLPAEMIRHTGYDNYISPGLWHSFIENYEALFKSPIELATRCKLQIAHCKLKEFQSGQQYDIIYFDAFAANRQPEMWDENAIGHTIKLLKPGGIFVTYAITGNLKRALRALDCMVEKAKGAPGKREMLRAIKT